MLTEHPITNQWLHDRDEEKQTTCSWCARPFGHKRKWQAVSGEICCSRDCAVAIYDGGVPFVVFHRPPPDWLLNRLK